MTNQRAVDNEASQVLEELEIHAHELERRNAYLKKMLRETRASPLRAFKDKIICSSLKLFARAKPLISSRASARFIASAEKRNPRRDDFLFPDRSSEFPFTYRMVLDHWSQLRSVRQDDVKQLLSELVDGPMVSVMMSIEGSEGINVQTAVASVLAQSYTNWELLLFPRGEGTDISALVSDLEKSHPRVSVLGLENRDSTTAQVNSAVLDCQSPLLLLMSATDVLDPDALLFVVRELRRKPDLKMIYTDHDSVTGTGIRYHPHFKPDWNRELFYGANYISTAVFLDRQVVAASGGFRRDYGDAQHYDLLLRCIEEIDDAQIGHVAKVLYSRRMPASVSDDSSGSARRALSDHLERVHGKPLQVIDGLIKGTRRVVWPLETEPLVSIIIPTRDRLSLTRTAVESILRETAYRAFEIIIVDNGSVEPETLEWFETIDNSADNLRIIRDERPFNYSALNNGAIRQSKGDVIALVNNDIEVRNGSWLSEMVSLAARPEVGCVGAKLYYPDGRIQHAGVRVGLDGVAGHPFLFFPATHPGYFGRLVMRQELSAVTAACLLLRRSVFDEVGGLNETDLAVAFNDIDLCLKVGSAGYRNIWTPFAELVHHESASRGRDNTPERKSRLHSEIKFMKTKWNTESFNDPAYNINVRLDEVHTTYAQPIWEV